MAQVYYVINDTKTRKSYQKAFEEVFFIGKKIGETVPGSQLGLTGYELQITGGSDSSGFPMMKYIEGQARKSLLMSRGPGAREINKPGIRRRKTVAGNTISPSTAQINMKAVKYGTKSIPELLGIQPKEEAKAEAKTEVKPEAPKAEHKPEAKKEAPKTEVKKEQSPEKKKEAKKE